MISLTRESTAIWRYCVELTYMLIGVTDRMLTGVFPLTSSVLTLSKGIEPAPFLCRCMCGIIGEISSEPVDLSTFCRMRDELSHRGPDGSGLYTSADERVALGFRRLAIIDLSDDGMQPMANEDESLYLLFNGEIYNYQSLRSELVDAGHVFSSETDSEVILHGYEEWGEAVLNRLRGMFAFAIWDESEGSLFAARDPFGIKPLYFYDGEDRFVFSSELKGILADSSIDRTLSTQGVQSYLKYGYVPAPLTIWENMSKLVPGEYLRYDGHTVETESYWSPTDYLDERSPPYPEAVSELQRILNDSVDHHLVSDVPLSVLLSGGVDSSTIAALAVDEASGLSAFSMGFDGGDDELNAAREVASLLGVDQTRDVLDSDALESLLDEVFYHFDEPLADTSIFPTFLLMESVSDHFKVVLSGDGGDELFAGYNWYDRYARYKRFNRLSPIFSLVTEGLDSLSSDVGISLVQSLKWRASLASKSGLDQYVSAKGATFSSDELTTLLDGRFGRDTDTTAVERYEVEWSTIKGAQCFDMRTFLPSILTKVDRASMANSVEARVPLLDREVAEYALSLDGSYHYNRGEKKRLLRSVSREILPDRVVDRPKSGFGAPLESMDFFSENIDALEASRAAEDGIFDQNTLDSYLTDDSPRQKLFRLLIFELWYRRWRQTD
ncbi:asparagine synthase (glutamine-hydrolyzing) [Halobaculum sp. MBLA0147]|uniref:asparagine synthase (glutamine-hydrolyzing) n=1 Tax=Halobaculum sp. MBLA0147 TaxID=3079934 RepID=UPI0035251E3B